jgi:1-acyl-sn-glycerol-3-phosphate acyltransferase
LGLIDAATRRAPGALADTVSSVEESPRSYRLFVALWRILARVYFRRIEVTGLDNVPKTGGGLLVSWHPNAIVDGCLILTHFPRPIVFGARHGLFRWPLLGRAMRAIGTVPIYRKLDFAAKDEEARREANRRSLDQLAHAVAGGRFVSLFPEGASHDEPSPTELKTGAARLYYRALELAPKEAPPPVILPVGLHYDAKRLFGSNALVAFHPPLENLPPPGVSEDEQRAQVRRLTAELGRVLHEVVYATESWELHDALHRTRKIIRAESAHRAGKPSARPDMKEKIHHFSRVWSGYNERKKTHPRETEELKERIFGYDADLRALGLDDHELDAKSFSGSLRLVGRVLAQAVLVYLVLPPILLIGFVANLPPGAAVLAVSKLCARAAKDEASLKMLLGAIAFPLSWLGVACLVAWGESPLAAVYPRLSGASWLTGASAFALSVAGAFVVVHYQRLALQTFRAIRVRLTKRGRAKAIRRLREERAAIYDDLLRLAGRPSEGARS